MGVHAAASLGSVAALPLGTGDPMATKKKKKKKKKK